MDVLGTLFCLVPYNAAYQEQRSGFPAILKCGGSRSVYHGAAIEQFWLDVSDYKSVTITYFMDFRCGYEAQLHGVSVNSTNETENEGTEIFAIGSASNTVTYTYDISDVKILLLWRMQNGQEGYYTVLHRISFE